MAFCTNCGAQVEEGAAFCSSCGTTVAPTDEKVESVTEDTATEETTAQEAVVEETPKEQEYHEEQPKEQKPNGVYGLGGAIASAVVSFVSFIFSMVSFVLGFLAAGTYTYEYHYSVFGSYYTYNYDEDMAIVSIVFGVIGLIVAIVGVILGIKAIRSFKEGKRIGRNPIGTLIVGIGGLSFAGSSAILALCGFVLAAAAL